MSNWYKEADNKFKWEKFISSFGWTVIAGLAAYYGFQQLSNQSVQKIQQEFYAHPDQVYDIAERIQQDQGMDDSSNFIDIPKYDRKNISRDVVKDNSQGNSFDYNRLYKTIASHEGKRNKVYLDSGGKPHIGVGFHIHPDRYHLLYDIGLNKQDIKNILIGKKSLTDNQIESLFKKDLAIAISDAQSFCPNFSEHPADVQEILINMAFNMGLPQLSGFKNMRKALEHKDYREVMEQMVDSQWYAQVGNRSKDLVKKMEQVAFEQKGR